MASPEPFRLLSNCLDVEVGSGKTQDRIQKPIFKDRRRNRRGGRNKKQLGTSASLLVTSALLVVTRSY